MGTPEDCAQCPGLVDTAACVLSSGATLSFTLKDARANKSPTTGSSCIRTRLTDLPSGHVLPAFLLCS